MNSTTRNNVIMVVDDSPDTLSYINDTLETSGYSVLVALEGSQALAILERIRPDMILLDAIMPHMDGFETCRRIKDNPQISGIPVIFMTGLTDTDSIVKGLDAGGVDYLTKPVNPDELLARMKVHLTNARQTSNAYTALDSTGQYLFSINRAGETVWATPQTYAFFTRANITPEEISHQLQGWLSTDPGPGAAKKLSDIDYPLSVGFVDTVSTGEVLLRLLDDQKPSAEETLREKLKLTVRESEVLFWISNGKANREIAQILDMSPRTVNKHLEQIFPKLGVDNRTAAARIALQALA